MASKKVPLYTIEEVVPKQQQGADKLEKYLSGIWGTVKENGKLVQLTRSSVQKLMAQQLVSLNGNVIKEKTCKVRANDVIVLRLYSLDIFKQQENDTDRKAQQDLKKQHIAVPTSSSSSSSAKKQGASNSESSSSSLSPFSSDDIDLVPNRDIPIDVIYEDEWLAVVNKPAGLLVHPTPQRGGDDSNSENQTHTLVNGLLHKYGAKGLSTMGGLERPGIVHRLDKDTAGILVIAKTDAIHQQLKDMLQEHTEDSISETKKSSSGGGSTKIQKKYRCLVAGKPKEQRGLIKRAIARHPNDMNKMIIDEEKGKPSLTEYTVVKAWNSVEVEVSEKKFNKVDNDDTTTTTTDNSKNNINVLEEYDTIVNSNKKNKSSKQQQKQSKQQRGGFGSLTIDDDDEDEVKPTLKVESDNEEDNESSEEEEEEEEEVEQTNKAKQSKSTSSSQKKQEDFQIKKKKIASSSYALLDITLHTGRTHQIRVHSLSEGMPIVGDPIYSGKSTQFMVPYLLLASVYLCFVHPVTKEKKEFTIPNPPHFQQFIELLDQAEKQKKNQQIQFLEELGDDLELLKQTKAHKITSSSSTKKQMKQRQYQGITDSDQLLDLQLLSSMNKSSSSKQKK
ncbi:hypothetical protein PPL_00850 [Heterostelium album PN500]|uniref:Pseudouridine synthase RsuA/RluA-like domain-containing protein n=1 Tax=Heterostelium pallidum (strain ATCC 26659 / Pp 5 / PN500) TaxID=670386 RepID=D3AYT1_HETP5|nr:hypothetical protein PPL_00850 [Heterostelium album PN500]EFA85621.1 hypothetical protein PPL_00850 [Heterostelium album PN500]|eukprot:XP_020437728.1 hypothetical protein PPL_00850 [Heterostelium album PN500]